MIKLIVAVLRKMSINKGVARHFENIENPFEIGAAALLYEIEYPPLK